MRATCRLLLSSRVLLLGFFVWLCLVLLLVVKLDSSDRKQMNAYWNWMRRQISRKAERVLQPKPSINSRTCPKTSPLIRQLRELKLNLQDAKRNRSSEEKLIHEKEGKKIILVWHQDSWAGWGK